MKSKNFLSKLWSSVAGSQRNDVEFDRRLTVGSPSGFTMNWTLKLVSVLAILLTVGVGNAWGTVATLTFSSSPSSGCSYTDNQSKSWTFTTDGGYLALDGGTTIHSGSGSKTASHVTFTSSAFTGATITQITITGYGSSCGAYATVNGSNFGTQNQTATSSGTCTFTGNVTVTGNVVVKIKRSSATKNAIYCSQVTVTYTTCTGLTMSSVTAVPGSGQIALSWPAVSHADSYTVSCKVKSTGVAAGTGTGSGKTGTSCTITGLTNDTEYTWSVEPVGSGTYCSSNTPATGDAIPGIYYTVTWKASGSSDVTTSVRNGTKPTFPDTPASCDLTSTTFYGWAAAGSLWSGKIDDISAKTIYTDASAMPNVSGAVTYHAVFAQSTGSGTATQAATISTSNPYISGTGWGMNISGTYTYSGPYLRLDADGEYVTFTSPKGAISRFQFTYKLNPSTTCTGHSGTAWWIGDVKFYVSTDGGSSWSELPAKSINDINTGTGLGSDVAKDYTDLAAGGYNAIKVQLAKDCGNLGVKGLSATYSNVTYSKYLVSCETCDDPTAIGKGSFNSSTHVQPITWTSAAGKVDICYSTSSTEPDDSPGSGYTVISGVTGYDDKSNTYDLDVSSLDPGNYYVWARSVCSASASSDWKAMASPGYFTLPGHTLTIAKTGGGSSSTTDPAVGDHSVTVGNSVSITASPASGYTFDSWSVSGTGSTLSSTSSNPTTFTMGTANSTVTATFSQIYVTSLKLRAQQTDQSDKTGSDLTMTCYPKEGQTGGDDPLNHTLNVAFNEVLPSTALDKTYDWSVRVKAKGDADWTAVSFTDNALNTNTIIKSYNKSTGNLQIKSTEGTAEIKITAHDGSGVTAKVTITVSNVAMSSVSVDPTEMTVYAGQKKAVAVTFTPANATDRSYSPGSSYSFVNIQNKAAASFNIEGKTSVTAETKNETVTVTTTDGGKTATVAVTIKPLPLVHFVDIIHNETFADVVATTDGSTVTFAKTVPTHADISPAPASGNDCEKEHLHLIGWIRSDYSKVSEYMESTGDAPTNAEITGAGAGYYYAAGAAITLTDDLHGKTFYAVWAKVE